MCREWDRSKSKDESDALIRHFLERGTVDSDGVRHSAKVAWRALALLEKEIEAESASATVPRGTSPQSENQAASAENIRNADAPTY